MSETTDRYRAVRAQLAARYPSTFTDSPDEPKQPLSITILRDLIDNCPDIPVSTLRMFVLFYTRGLRYLTALKPGARRVNLLGNCCGHVTAFQAQQAVAAAEATREYRAQQLKAKEQQ